MRSAAIRDPSEQHRMVLFGRAGRFGSQELNGANDDGVLVLNAAGHPRPGRQVDGREPSLIDAPAWIDPLEQLVIHDEPPTLWNDLATFCAEEATGRTCLKH